MSSGFNTLHPWDQLSKPSSNPFENPPPPDCPGPPRSFGAEPKAKSVFFNYERIKKIAKVAAMFFIFSLIAISTVVVVNTYPVASNIYYSAFTATAAISLIYLAIFCIKRKDWQKRI